MSGPLFNEARVDERPLRPVEKPGPGLFDFNWDATRASAEEAAMDAPGRSYETRQGRIAAASAELAKLQGKRPSDYYISLGGEPVGGGAPLIDEDRFWADLARLRQGRPDALADLGSDKSDFDKRLQAEFQKGAADRQRRMAQGGLIGNLAGGMAGAFTDPVNVMTLPIGGGGRTAAAQIVRNALANAGIEAIETPFISAERVAQGRPGMTAGEVAFNVGAAGLGGGALTGAAIGAGKVLDTALDASMDWRMAQALRKAVPDDAMTPDQVAALRVLERGAEVDASNPFQGTYAGLDTHAEMVDQVLSAMARSHEVPEIAPLPSPPQARDLDSAFAAIVAIEGGTNRDGSFRTSPVGAIGPAQVMPGTAPIAAKLAGLPWDPVRYRGDAEYNLALGRAYYQDMLRQFGGDPVKAAAAYNAGPGSARSGRGVRGAMRRAEAAGRPADWVDFLPAETRKYVANFRRRTGMAPGEDIAEAGQAPGPIAEPLMLREDVLQAGLVTVVRDVVAGGERSLNRLPELAQGLGVDEVQLRRALDRLVDQGDITRTGAGIYRRRAQSGPEDMLRFITREGGLSYDGLNDAGRALGTRGHDLRNTGHLATMVPGGGPLLRPTGRSLDDMGERLWDAGYFGPPEVTPRPTEGELITLLDDAIRLGEKRYSAFDDAPEPRSEGAGAGGVAGAGGAEARARDLPQEFQSDEHYRAERDAYDAAAQDVLGRSLGDDEFLAAWRIGAEQPALPRPDAAAEEAIIARNIGEMVNREIDEVAAREVTLAELDELEAEGLAGPVHVDEAFARAFDDPDGEGIASLADGLWHDIEARMLAEGEAYDIRIDLDDGQGERSLAEIRDELTADGADIDMIEACLAPAMGAA